MQVKPVGPILEKMPASYSAIVLEYPDQHLVRYAGTSDMRDQTKIIDISASIACQGVIGEDKFVVVEAAELWETRRGFPKPCGKAAGGRLSIRRQIHSWVRRGCRGRRGQVLPQPGDPEFTPRIREGRSTFLSIRTGRS